MQSKSRNLDLHTPSLTAVDPRRLTVRSVGYYRSVESETAEPHINHTSHDPAGRAIAQRDPRLFLDASAPANLSAIYSMSGAVLCEVSVDSGMRLSLFGEAGQPVHSWDGRGSQRWMHYDLQLRLTELFEQAAQGEAICAERLNYAANEPAFADHNQCGRLICHEDPPGALRFNDYALTGAALAQERLFADQPSPAFITRSRFNPLGDLLSRTDAKGNEQRFSQTLDGQLRAVDLRLNDTPDWLPMASAIRYTPHGQVQQEVAGNGVTTSLEYTEEDGRLKRLVSRLGQDDPFQDLGYAYDPAGNVSSIEDAASPVRYFANQRVAPVSHYGYDTLYRLIEVTGWEAGSVNHGPASLKTTNPAMPGNYRQTYRYDNGNNLLELTHVGPQNHGHRLVAAAHSNRCLPVRDGIEPGEVDFRDGFDANGNLLRLQPGQTLDWDVRNQLKEVRPVQRDSGSDDVERYDYGADGMRVRKVRSLQTNAQTNRLETLYLPGLQIRNQSGTGEVLHVIEVTTGRGSVRVLHWVAGKPEGIANNQQRFSLTDHLGSSTLELDQYAKIISQERYYPFGGTAWSNGETVQVSYKTVRYSGKEQDATGFYYYGFRYYVPWLQRWLNPDPAGSTDGLNLYCMVRGNPITLQDVDGRQSTFKEQFKPELGDLIFGASRVVEENYLSLYARLMWRKDLVGMYFSRAESRRLVLGLSGLRLEYVRADHYSSVEGEASSGWQERLQVVSKRIENIENKFYGAIESGSKSILSSKANKTFSKEFAAELSSGGYSVFRIFHKYRFETPVVLERKLIGGASKAAILTMLKSSEVGVVHFILDDLDMAKVVQKTETSFAAPELRFLYRNRQSLEGKILFYKNGKLADAPWRTHRTEWGRYKPKSFERVS